jgi:hypothetical protein
MIEFIGPLLQLVTTFHKSLSSTGHSQLLTTLLIQMNCQLLLVFRYIASGRTTQKTQCLAKDIRYWCIFVAAGCVY